MKLKSSDSEVQLAKKTFKEETNLIDFKIDPSQFSKGLNLEIPIEN